MRPQGTGPLGRVQLFTGFYAEEDVARRAEILECLHRNLANAAVDRVFLAAEVPAPVWGGKLTQLPVPSRPCFADFFAIINARAGPHDVSVLHNSDIYFDEGVGQLPDLDLAGRCLALSRWDVGADGTASPSDRADSQDAWVFLGRVRPVGDATGASFPLGVPGCDNRIAWLLRDAGYSVSNPCREFRAYHLHRSGRRGYTGGAAVQGPYLLVPPDADMPPRRW